MSFLKRVMERFQVQNRNDEPTVDEMTVSELQDLVLETRGFRPSKEQVLDVVPNKLFEGLLQGGMDSPGKDGMGSPDASVFREPDVSDSMTQDEFLARFDAAVLVGDADSDSSGPDSGILT